MLLTIMPITNSLTDKAAAVSIMAEQLVAVIADEKGNIKIIEIGSRMGGDCIGSDLVEISTGYDFLKMVIDVSCGNKPDFKKSDEANNCAIKFILNENDLNKLKFLQENYSKNIYKISDIEPFTHEVSDSSSRFGYYILQWNKDEDFMDVFNTVI